MNQAAEAAVETYPFNQDSLIALRADPHIQGNWPVVYILCDPNAGRAYIGETTDALSRLGTHLRHPEKGALSQTNIISSFYFNKSATLDLESSLIELMHADETFTLLNANLGLVDHNYYQKNEVYRKLLKKIWEKLVELNIAKKPIEQIHNSDVFKYSPYKSLSPDQIESLVGILDALVDNKVKTLLVEGEAGTGKSVLAIFLFKLLHSNLDELELGDFLEEELILREYLIKFKKKYPELRMALVVPMASFRSTLKRAFRNIAGLSPKMVIGPAELSQQDYDIILVDESHRLRKRKNLGSYFGRFDQICEQFNLDRHACSEVDWVCHRSKKAVFFYDPKQSIKPSDANAGDFQRIRADIKTKEQKLVSQFRVNAGGSYSEFICDLLNVKVDEGHVFHSPGYEFALFENIDGLVRAIRAHDQDHGLARLVAGYSWPWLSQQDPEAFDIQIEKTQLRWNRSTKDWINSEGSINEVGCIHTTQGYDLNYAGVIFGREIDFDPVNESIVIQPDLYHDRNGRVGIEDPDDLKRYILNIYQTLLMRGIRGTLVYAVNPELRAYLKRHVPLAG